MKARIAAIACGLLCVLYAALSWSAASGKSATVDEPVHVVNAWMMRNGDFRQTPDVPALWEEWISLAIPRDAIHLDPNDPMLRTSRPFPNAWITRVLFKTRGTDGVDLVRRCRAIALVLSVAMGAIVARWGWRLGGPVAAICGTTMWALDPNLLGHGALANNDVAIAAAYGLLGYATWQTGLGLTWRRGALFCAVAAVGPLIKLSGVAFIPVACLALLVRAILSEPWPVLGQVLHRRTSRILASASLCVAASLATYVLIWAAYGFRFDAGPGGQLLDTQSLVHDFIRARGSPPDAAARLIVWMEQHHLMPQAWIDGLLMLRTTAVGKLAYLCGQTYIGGKWDYFPLAFVFKEPLAMLAAVGLSLFVGMINFKRRISFAGIWAAASLGLPAAIYLLTAMSSNLNLGIRYLFPIYPYLFVAMGLAGAWLWRRFWWGKLVVPLLAITLATEVLAAYPDYIAFFNAECGERGGFALLSDSNLDWGQDLPLLAQWEKANPDTLVYLAYFGTSDPAAYRHIEIPESKAFHNRGGTIFAVSATALQEQDVDRDLVQTRAPSD
ncbi:MAG TPA: hypothetical protein VL992_10595, partial [Tepidisphaeraceae bacterium]|nr:hypothetical protein [Tepidisphaeraceae bacterium]